jgi:hypothetical protein
MCIDYRKIDKATQKDHFPLHFIDEMLERLANHSVCYLNCYSGYHQILIHLDEQSKTTFTCLHDNSVVIPRLGFPFFNILFPNF